MKQSLAGLCTRLIPRGDICEMSRSERSRRFFDSESVGLKVSLKLASEWKIRERAAFEHL
jgi:hypothetical protein